MLILSLQVEVAGDVLEQTGLDLLGHAATAPGLEQVRHVAAGQVRRELGLEGLVLEDGDVDLHVRMGGRVLIRERLPQRQARIVVLDVVPVDLDRRQSASDGAADGAADGAVDALVGAALDAAPEHAPAMIATTASPAASLR